MNHFSSLLHSQALGFAFLALLNLDSLGDTFDGFMGKALPCTATRCDGLIF